MTVTSNTGVITVRSSESASQTLTSPHRPTMNIQEYTPVGVATVGGRALFIQEAKEGSVLSAHDLGPSLAIDEDEQEARQYVSALWAKDWDCEEDSVYDTW